MFSLWSQQSGSEDLMSVALTDVFCSNIYGCAAGAAMMTATFPASTKRCAICRNQSLPLLLVFARGYIVSECWFCRSLFSMSSAETSLRTDDGVCLLCGQRYSKSGMLAGSGRFPNLVAVARSLIETRESVSLMNALWEKVTPANDIVATASLFIASIANPAIHSVAVSRLGGILRSRELQSFSPPDPGKEPSSNGTAPQQESDAFRRSRSGGLTAAELVRLSNALEPIVSRMKTVDRELEIEELDALVGAAEANTDDETRERLKMLHAIITDLLEKSPGNSSALE